MHALIIDGNNIGIAAQMAAPELRDATGRPAGAIFVFAKSLRAIVEKMRLEDPVTDLAIFVLWDSSPSWRLQILPGYKESRKEKPAEMERKLAEYRDQLPFLRALLHDLGTVEVRAPSHEADDLAGWLAAKFPKATLVTGDHDWFQLVNETTRVFQPRLERFVTLDNFEEVTGCVSPQQFTFAMALAGDSGDDVPGAQGIGIKTAAKYLSGNLKTGKKYDTIKAWIEDPEGYVRTYKLVSLTDLLIDPSIVQMNVGALDRQKVMATCIEFGFESIISHFDNWLTPFYQSTKGA